MVLAQNKKKNYFFSYFFVILAVAGSLFFLSPSLAHAGAVGDVISYPFKMILYGIFLVMGFLVSVALTLFEWAIDPSYISGAKSFLNASSTYGMWKFVRDFFNLFFILSLLYLAFTTIFQVAKDYKKSLLSLVIMALLVNFSFPISRFLIDVTNVPMYFFASQIFSGTAKPGQDALSSVLSASKLENILIQKEGSGAEATFNPNSPGNTFARLIMAIVFMFIFAITLLVLAVMFVIRLIALVLLVIFSAVGFVGPVIPGMADLSEKWWKQFWNYALYGPAAMLMLLIATRFFSQIGSDSTFDSMKAVSSGITPDSSMAGFVGSMAMFSIPIVMLWFAIGLAGSFSMIGAGAVVGWGQGFIKKSGKKFGNGAKWVGLHNPVTNTARGAGQGVKQRFNDNKWVKWAKSPSWFEAGAKGAATGKGWKSGAKSAQTRYRDEQVREKVEEHKKNKTNASVLEADMKSQDEVKRRSAAFAIADSKNITTPERLHLALSAVADDMDQYAKILQSADGKALNMSVTQIEEATAERDSEGKIKKDAAGKIIVNSKALDAVSGKAKKEGQANTLVEYQVSTTGVARDVAIEDVLKGTSMKEKVKQESLFTNPLNSAAVRSYVGRLDAALETELRKAAAQESQVVHNVLATIP